MQARIEQSDDLENDLEEDGLRELNGGIPTVKGEQNGNGMNGVMKEEESDVTSARDVPRPRREEVEKPKPSVFAGLDLYDPDDE